MSTYWDVVCLDCDLNLGLHLNHGEAACVAVIKAREAFALLHETLDYTFVKDSVSVHGERGHVDVGFFHAHKNHFLAPVSEYGDIHGVCNERERREDSTPELPISTECRCELLTDHEEPHSFVKRYRRWEPGWQVMKRNVVHRLKLASRTFIKTDSKLTCPCGSSVETYAHSSRMIHWLRSHIPHAPGGVERTCAECRHKTVKAHACLECGGKGWHVGECHPQETCGACDGTGRFFR